MKKSAAAYVVDDWKLVQRLVHLVFVEKSMTGENVAREIINILAVPLGIQSHLLIAAMRDGASVNSVPMRTVRVIFPHVLDLRCFSHILDLARDRLETPISFLIGFLCFHTTQKLAHYGRNRPVHP